MDCCGYGYRGGYGWEGYYGAPAHGYYAPAHEPPPYARYYYPPHYPTHAEHSMPMEYGAYAVKESRARRVLSRRERAHLAAQHAPPTHTPPLECGINSRGPPYCETPMWPHFQQGMPGVGWSGMGGYWGRAACREPMRYAPDCRLLKDNMHPQTCAQDGASHYAAYDMAYGGEAKVKCGPAEPGRPAPPEPARPAPDSYAERPRPPTPDKRPPVVPLPAFQQAFGSTEIGKFAEAFSRADVAHDSEEPEGFAFDSFGDWDGPSELQWPQAPPREIKCEDNF